MTGKSKTILLPDRQLTYFNQRCRDWTHLYEYEHNGGNLANSGCGIFSLCHCAEFLTGQVQDPEEWADFGMEKGGRGDDGTDRPLLLHTLMAYGENKRLGFRYEEDGLRNDLDTLFDVIYSGRGVSMCNLRVGHIVALVGARIVNGEKQLLAVDSYSESASEKVRDAVTEVLSGSEITYTIRNSAGLDVGEGMSYGAFWVKATQPRDFNLLYKL